MMKPSIGTRHEKSLGRLTSRFATLLREAEDGLVDLKDAAVTLDIKQKRRIYDITNVLEGIGLIIKKSKNQVQYIGARPGTNTEKFEKKVQYLQNDIRKLDEIEKELDQRMEWTQQSLRNITAEPSHMNYAYVTQEDVTKLFPDKAILAIKPKQINIAVSVVLKQADESIKYNLDLKAQEESIDCFLLDLKSPPEDDLVDESPDIFGLTSLIDPMLSLSPPPTEEDYRFVLAKHEGLIDMFDLRV